MITLQRTVRYVEPLQRNAILYIALPNSYVQQPNKRYPVLYCHDGHNLFFKSDSYAGVTWGMETAMALPTMPEFIVVALSCATKGNQRLEEYNVFQGRFPSHPTWKIDGRGRQYLDYVLGPLKTKIDTMYRTLPDAHHTFMMGSSMGGVISLEAAFLYPHRVQHFAGLSNAFYVSTPELLEMISRFQGKLHTVYLDTGDAEVGLEVTNSYLVSNRIIQKTIKEKGCVERFFYQEIQGGVHHESSWQARLPFVLHFLFQNYQ